MKTHLLLLCAAGALLAGCTTVDTVERAEPVGQPAIIADKRVSTDPSLARKVTVVRVIEDVASGDHSKVQVTLQSNRNRSMTINYVFEWFDLNGMRIETAGGGWRSLRFMGRETKTITSIAPSPRAVDFTLKLQEP